MSGSSRDSCGVDRKMMMMTHLAVQLFFLSTNQKRFPTTLMFGPY